MRSAAQAPAWSLDDDLDAAPPAPPWAQSPAVAAYRWIVRAYVPGRYRGRVTVLVPEQRRPTRPDLWWSAVAREVDVRMVPGAHLTVVTVHVEALAAQIGASLTRSDDAASRPVQS